MKMSARVRVGFFLCLVGLWVSWAPAVFAQAKYPVRPIRVRIPFPAGGGADTIGRTIAEPLSAQLGQPIVIDNRPGAGGRLATELLAKAEPDGHTLLVGTVGGIAISPALFKNLPYDVERDILPLRSSQSSSAKIPRAGPRSSGTRTSRSNSRRPACVVRGWTGVAQSALAPDRFTTSAHFEIFFSTTACRQYRGRIQCGCRAHFA